MYARKSNIFFVSSAVAYISRINCIFVTFYCECQEIVKSVKLNLLRLSKKTDQLLLGHMLLSLLCCKFQYFVFSCVRCITYCGLLN